MITDVVELRQYTLHPGTRETLIDVFDGELVEPQEALGLRVIGQFRDLDRPDRFVWLRGFADMASRRRGLAAFYGGPDWAAHRDVANATMIDSDDVLLLRPVTAGTGFPPARPRPAVGVDLPPPGLVTITVFALAGPPDAAVLAAIGDLDAALTAAGAPGLAVLRTEPTPNDFPALPVREGEQVVVRVSRFDDADRARRVQESPGSVEASARLAPMLSAAPQVLRLAPTARSLLR